MRHKTLLFLLLTIFPAILRSQASVPDSLATLFHQQLMSFPQEKIYLHTDKPYYVSGEQIWFRAHIADAVTHAPFPISRYVYVELINPLDSVITRVKILQDDEDAYHGHLIIPEEIPEGDYTLRAYTTFMRSQDENYFFNKTVRINIPQSQSIKAETNFTFESDRKINAEFKFTNPNTSSPVLPKTVNIRVNDGEPININRVGNDGTASVSFNLPASSNKRVIILSAILDNMSYQQYIHVPVPDNDFDVAFYPEGGSLIQGITSNVAFKALKSNGNSADITGIIYDKSDTQIGEFKTDYLGMGKFTLLAEKGKSYYAVCKNEKGQSKRFDLPAAAERGYALSVNQTSSRIMVSVLDPEGSKPNDELYILAHIRGMIYLAKAWEHGKSIVIQKELSPSGVMHLVLFDSKFNPLSERLLFINNHDEAKVTSQFPIKKDYTPRSLVKKNLILTDNKGQPLLGNFSVSVTSDREVKQDSTSTILTQLLLTSDLYGHIENPGYYFQNTSESAWALDLLMLTQGWRRYDISKLAKSNFTKPVFPLEDSPEISGIVKSLVSRKPVKDLEVSIWSYDGNYFDVTKTDSKGQFYFLGGELPDSTGFVVSTVERKGAIGMDLILDKDDFPKKTLPFVPAYKFDTKQLETYTEKAERKYLNEFGMRNYFLSEVVITGKQMPRRKSNLVMYQPPPKSHTITAQDIQDFPASDIFMLLSRIPGVIISGESINVRRGVPLIVVDDFPVGITFLNNFNIYNIEQIDVIKISGGMPIYGSKRLFLTEDEIAEEALGSEKEKKELPFVRSMDGGSAIMIYTKKGQDYKKAPVRPSHIKTIFPLGYQKPVEFYAPKYDTLGKKNSITPDLRTTIHWQPVIKTNSQGEAAFEFYTDDEAASFTMVIEGLTDNGTIIRYRE